MSRVTVIIPAWNEAEHIGQTVQAAYSIPEVDMVLVVDDGSTDDTPAKAAAAGAQLLKLSSNQGKGRALQAGILSCRAEVVVLLDADLGESARLAEALLEPVLVNEADMTIAQFPPSGPAGFGLLRGWARWGIRALTGLDMKSPLSGQRAARRSIFDRLQLADDWGVEIALTVDAARLGYRLLEVPVAMTHRQTGRTWRGFIHRGRQFLGVTRALLPRLMRSEVAVR